MKIKKINPTLDELSRRETDVLNFIQDYIRNHRWHYPPSIREIAAHVDMSVGGTADVIRRLKDYGYLRHRHHDQR